MNIVEENEARRRVFCRPLTRDPEAMVEEANGPDGLFFCELGTLWCTEGHGDWEVPYVYRETARRPRLTLKNWVMRFHHWFERHHPPREWVFSHRHGGYDVWRCSCGKEFHQPG